MNVKEESEKIGLKLNIQKMKIMASCPITSWQIDGEAMKQWETLFFWTSKSLQMVTAFTKQPRTLAPWKKSYDKPRQHIKKQRHYFVDKGPSSKSYGFSSSQVGIWELDYKESWVPKDRCFWTMVLETTLESPLRSNQSILKEISPECSLEHWMFIGCWSWNSNTLATWCKELTHWKRPWCWERLKAGGEGDDRGWDGWMASLTWWTWVWINSGSWWWTGRPGMLQCVGSPRVRHNGETELNWW